MCLLQPAPHQFQFWIEFKEEVNVAGRWILQHEHLAAHWHPELTVGAVLTVDLLVLLLQRAETFKLDSSEDILFRTASHKRVGLNYINQACINWPNNQSLALLRFRSTILYFSLSMLVSIL